MGVGGSQAWPWCKKDEPTISTTLCYRYSPVLLLRTSSGHVHNMYNVRRYVLYWMHAGLSRAGCLQLVLTSCTGGMVIALIVDIPVANYVLSSSGLYPILVEATSNKLVPHK